MAQRPPEKQTWQSIAHAKQSHRASLISPAWTLPQSLIPHDPSSPSDGPQNVLSVPATCGILTPQEVEITESYSVKSLLSALARGEVSSVAVTTAFAKRAAIAQQLTNCLTEILFADAIARAEQLDAYMQEHEGKTVGPLHGLVVSVKDTFHVAGYDSSVGLAGLCFKPASHDASLVALLKSLGAVVLCKTNVAQAVAALDSVNNVWGRTMNPLARRCTAGGSSGGEGVIVAMGGCMVGWGTDVGGSVRVPAMCNGVYCIKPSHGRLPYGGQGMTSLAGMSRTSVHSVVGPLARRLEDIDTVMREVVPRGSLWATDVNPGGWSGKLFNNPCGRDGSFRVGILRSDGNCTPLPPIMNVVNEVAEKLKRSGVQVVDLPTPTAWTKCQSVMSKLMSVDGNQYALDIIESTGEPLIQWLSTRLKRAQPKTLFEVAALQAQRAELEDAMRQLWVEDDGNGGKRKRFGAIICPVAPHPVPQIETYNAVGYTSSFVMLDWPAGTIPVRNVSEKDLEVGKPQAGKPLGSWDAKNREMWDEKLLDRRIYLDTPLSVQVVTMKGEDERLIQAMHLIDDVIHGVDLKAKI